MQTAALLPALALLAGAAAGTFIAVPVPPCLVILGTAWTASVVAWVGHWSRLCVVALACGFASGAALAAGAAAVRLDEPDLIRHLADAPLTLEGRLREDASPTEFGATLTLDVDRVEVDGRMAPTSGAVRLSVGGALSAASLPEWRAGRTVRVVATLRRPLPYRNFGLPPQEHRLALRGVRLLGSVKSAALVEVRARGPRWSEAAATIRAWSRETLHRTIGQRDPEAAGVVTAVLIGDRAGLSADVEQRLQRAGTFHIIAISGGNVAVLAGIVLFLVARTGLSPRVRALTGMTTLVVYAGTVMGGASVTRATLAAAIYLGARAGDLRTGGRSVMAATLATIVAMDPVLVADPGFWLTFLASLAIVERAAAVSARIERGWLSLGGWPQPPIVRSVVVLFAATLVAETILVPVTAYVFAQVTAAGLVLNFAAIPAMAVVQIAGLATLAAAAVHPVLAGAPGAIAALAAQTILESAGLVRYAPWAVWRVPPPPLWLVAVALAAWLAAAFSWRRSGRIAGAATWTVAMAAILLGPVLPAFDDTVLRHPACHEPEFPGALLRLTILDVGQGAAVLVRLPDGRSFLVDAGGGAARSRFDVGGRVVSPAVWALGVRRLSALVLTHGDIDHVGGAPALVEDVVPSAIWEGVPVSGLPALDAVRRAAEQHAVPWLRVTRGDAFKLSEVALQVWHPPRTDWERRRVRNDDSIVLELRVGRVSVILPGDIGAGVEGELATLVQPAAVRVLLAAHHGSRGSTSGRWLQALDPDVVIVSAGRSNPHGHPAPAMLDRVRAHGASIYRTDVDGAIQVDTDGSGIVVTTCAGERRAFS